MSASLSTVPGTCIRTLRTCLLGEWVLCSAPDLTLLSSRQTVTLLFSERLCFMLVTLLTYYMTKLLQHVLITF